MEFDDIIYMLCLLSCIGFGQYYRQIKDDSQRKLVGTALGLIIVFIVSGVHILHTLISFTVCTLLITLTHPSQCHLLSFGFMFAYLAFFRTTIYFGIPYPPGHTNMIQMLLTLKVVGLAFEKNTAYNKIKQRNAALSDPAKRDEVGELEITEFDTEMQTIDFAEIFHYCFSYIGILTGPYYRYRTYRDYFETPFRNYAKSKEATISKLKEITIYVVLYLIAGYLWPLNYAMDPEFYEKRSFFYRVMYIWPTFFIFRMRIYSGLILGETVCTNAGFGAYPDEADVASGEGPKKHYLQFKRNPEQHSYNFNTIRNADVYGVETCWTFREAMKYWNICVQYWLAVNVYKRFPTKKYRQIATLLVSSFWHGVYSGYYMCIMSAAYLVPIEAIFDKFFRKDAQGLKRKIIDCMFLMSKHFSLCYLGIAFNLLSFDKIWYYYKIIATLLVSSFWHGVYTGYYMCIMGAAIYTPIEDIYQELIRKDAFGTTRGIIDVIFWISKFFSFSYLGIAFLLMTFDKIWYYYGSIYHFGYVYFAVLFTIGAIFLKQRKARDRQKRKARAGASDVKIADISKTK